MTASLNNVVTVTLLPEGKAVARDNMNVVALMTSQQGYLSTAKRYEIYRSLTAVAENFGTNSDVYQHALAFFGTVPNAVQAGGVLVIGYHRATSEEVAATSGALTGAQVAADTLLDQLRQISDGSFEIVVDGDTLNPITVNNLDFRTSLSLTAVAAAIDSVLNTDATCEWDTDAMRFIIRSATTGALSAVSFATDAAAGTSVAAALGLSDGSGATLTVGAAAATLTAETKLAAVQALKALVNFKGFVFLTASTTQEVADLGAWSKAAGVMGYDVFSASSNLLVDVTNPVWINTLAGRDTYRCLFSKSANRKMATSYMARKHTVNFAAENTAITMNLKTLSVPAEEYTEGEITAAANVGLDIYTTFKRVPKVLTSAANDFADNAYNLLAFVDAVQTDMFNLLGTTATKIPQTIRGVNQLIDQAEKTTRGFARAGVFAAGEWSSPDFFGDIDVFKRNIREKGFYWLAGSLAEQPQDDRQARKSPVLQGAVKNAGAIHKADIIINFNY